MKKILLSVSIVAVVVMMTVCVSCKKDEPSKGLDFTNLTLELLESCIDKDSVTIVNALVEQGFVKIDDRYHRDLYGVYYENKSYGLGYGFGSDGKMKNEPKGLILNFKDKEKFYEYSKQIKDKKLPLFCGEFYDLYPGKQKPENFECTDNIDYFFEKEKDRIDSDFIYANDKLYYGISRNDIDKTIYVAVGKSDPDDPFNEYNYAKYGCGYDPRGN